MKRPALAILAVAGLALTGCAGQTEAAPVTVTETAPATIAAPTTSAVDNTLAYQAWATRARAPITKWVEDWDPGACSITGLGKGEDPLCMAKIVIAEKQIAIFAQDMGTAFNKDYPDTYLGAEPPELTKTIDAVLAAARAAATPRDEWVQLDCFDKPDENGCTGLALKMTWALEDLDTALKSLEK